MNRHLRNRAGRIRSTSCAALLAVLVASLVIVSNANALPVDLDTGFGDAGLSEFSIGASHGTGVSVRAIAGPKSTAYAQVSVSYQTVILRVTAAGTLDRNWGTNGRVTLPYRTRPLVVDRQGRVVIAGDRRYGPIQATTEIDTFVTRLDTDGSPDPTFGANGSTTLNLGSFAPPGSGQFDYPISVRVLSDGSPLILFNHAGSDAILRLTAAGSIDSTYGSGGVTNLGVWQQARQLITWPDDSSAVFGTTNTAFFVAHLDQNGALNASYPFSPDGKLFHLTNGKYFAEPTGCTALAHGNLGCTGSWVSGSGRSGDNVAVRIRPNDTLDPTFGGDGITTVYHHGEVTYDSSEPPITDAGDAMLMAFQPQGPIGYIVMRFTAAGALDNGFGGGMLTIPPLKFADNVSAVRDTYGRLIVMNMRDDGNNTQNWVDVRRYRADSADLSVTGEQTSEASSTRQGRPTSRSSARGRWIRFKIHNRGPLAPGVVRISLSFAASQRIIGVRGAKCTTQRGHATCLVRGLRSRGNRYVMVRLSRAGALRARVRGMHHDDRARNNRVRLRVS